MAIIGNNIRDMLVDFCMSNTKASAAYNRQATTNIISILGHGKLPDNSKCEAFLDRKRIPGGDRTDFPCLPCNKLSDVEVMLSLYEEAERYRRICDGCYAQYQGKGAFRGMQTMNARHDGLNSEDFRQRPHHREKNRADAAVAAVGGMVRNSSHDNYGEGAQNLGVMFDAM